jgi:putative transposon-encoded protein
MKVEFENAETIIEKTVVKSGTGAIVYIPKEHLGKKVKVVVFNEPSND